MKHDENHSVGDGVGNRNTHRAASNATPEAAPAENAHGALEARLRREGTPFVTATVVRREPPISATVGDRAIVTADGTVHGWIGGVACAQAAITSEALSALEDGQPRLVGLAPEPETVDRPGLVARPMTCHSEGTLEVFVEPVTPPTQLVVVGGSPVARSLRRLAAELPLEVVAVDSAARDGDDATEEAVVGTTEPSEIAAAVGDRPLVVVATMGEFDARGVAAGLLAGAPYVGLVASETRAREVVDRVAERTDRDEASVREAVTSPAGVDIGAHTPAEIAVSVLAEIVDVTGRNSTVERSLEADEPVSDVDEPANEGEGPVADAERDSVAEGEAAADASDCCSSAAPEHAELESTTDPVCGMDVDPETAAATVDHDGNTYAFCCHGCADSFRADPAEHLDSFASESVGSP